MFVNFLDVLPLTMNKHDVRLRRTLPQRSRRCGRQFVRFDVQFAENRTSCKHDCNGNSFCMAITFVVWFLLVVFKDSKSRKQVRAGRVVCVCIIKDKFVDTSSHHGFCVVSCCNLRNGGTVQFACFRQAFGRVKRLFLLVDNLKGSLFKLNDVFT